MWLDKKFEISYMKEKYFEMMITVFDRNNIHLQSTTDNKACFKQVLRHAHFLWHWQMIML